METNLTARDREKLSKSWLNQKLIERGGIRRVDGTQGRALLNRKKGDCAGIAFPYYWPGEEDHRGVRIRLDAGDPKYLAPSGKPNLLYIPPGLKPELLDSVRDPIVITEGEKKTLALLRLSSYKRQTKRRFVPIGLGGVWNWKTKVNGKESEPLPDFDKIAWAGEQPDGKTVRRTVYVLFDADVHVNPNVRAARAGLSRELARRGANVVWVNLPQVSADLKGVDDFLGDKDWGPDKVLEFFQYNLEPFVDSYAGTIWEALLNETQTDLGNSKRLILCHSGPNDPFDLDFLWCEELKTFLLWDGRRWRPGVREMWARAEQTIDMLESAIDKVQESGRPLRDSELRSLRNWVDRSRSDHALKAMLECVKHQVLVKPEHLDRDLWMLNCEDGTVNLKTGELQVHNPRDLITRFAPVRYKPREDDGDYEQAERLWWDFLRTAFPEKDERVFMLKALGTALTGDTTSEVFYLLYGETQTGKSTITGPVLNLLGDYAAALPDIAALRSRQQAGSANPELARLEGKRFVSCSETEQNERMVVSQLKRMTGGDKVTARALYQSEREFDPTWKIFIPTNYLLQLPDDDEALWRRIVQIPFKHRFTKPDPKVKEAFLNDPNCRTAILRSLVKGCMAWQKAGTNIRAQMPAAVAEATQQYQREMDRTAEFVREHIGRKPGAWTAAETIWRIYKLWLQENPDAPRLTQKALGIRLAKEGFAAKTRRDDGVRKRGWMGVEVAY